MANPNMIQVTFKPEMHEKVVKMASDYGVSKSSAVTIICRQYFEAVDNMGTLKELLQKANEELAQRQKPDIEKRQIHIKG